MAGKKKVERTPVSYHEWVLMEARLYGLMRRAEFSGDDLKKAGKLTREERSELAFLRKCCETSDETTFALLHHCEAISGGVIVPAKEVSAVCTALKDAYRVSGNDEGERDALVKALMALGVAKKDLPKCIDEEDEE